MRVRLLLYACCGTLAVSLVAVLALRALQITPAHAIDGLTDLESAIVLKYLDKTYFRHDYFYFNGDVAQLCGGGEYNAGSYAQRVCLDKHFADWDIPHNEERQTAYSFYPRQYRALNDAANAACPGNTACLHDYFQAHVVYPYLDDVGSICASLYTMFHPPAVNVFDYQYYHDHYPDVAKLYGDPTVNADKYCLYFENQGIAAGQQASATFNVEAYRARNPDLANLSNFDLIIHYIKVGAKQNRVAV